MSHWSRIVVGVDGSPSSLNAVRYAAQESARNGSTLLLVHVIPGPSATLEAIDPVYPLDRAELRRVGRQILDEAARVASEHPGITITRKVVDGDLHRMLLQSAPVGSLLVLGDQRLSVAQRLITRSVLDAVASRAPGAVTVVPQNWTLGPRCGRIAVGIASIENSGGLLWRAFQAAHERHGELRILHAWEFRIRYGHVRVEEDQLASRRAEMKVAMTPELDSCRADFPDVHFHIDVVNGQPAKALADATDDADLLLLARRTNALSRPHLGVTGKAVLHAARCPVEVVSPAAEPVWERDCDLEIAGDLLVR